MFVDLDAARDITCGVTAADNIRCWGELQYGPVIAEGFTAVESGRRHTCGIKTDGTLQCWGRGSTYNDIDVPTESDGSAIKFSRIHIFDVHTCGLKQDGTAVCWGDDRQGQSSGQPESGSYQAYDYSNESFTQIATGAWHTCGLKQDGQLACWGSNFEDESETPEEHRDKVFRSVQLGNEFTCGLIEDPNDDGRVVCWGSDSSDVVTETSPNERFTEISAGYFHVCGIRKDKTANCWGGYDPGDSNYYGQGEVPEEYVETKFSKIAAGYYHNCGTTDGSNGQTAGDVVCWGAEIEYDPLNPDEIDGGRTTPPDFFYPPTGSLPNVGTGRFNNCALTVGKDMICWGGSVYAETFVEGPFETLSVGDEHVCALREGGVLNCWGRLDNTFRQASGWAKVGKALAAQAAFVRDLATSYTFKEVSANRFHSCGILRGVSPLPIEPPLESGGDPRTRAPSEIFNDFTETETITELSDGQVLCWGLKVNGQSLPPSDTFAKISAGLYHACGLLDEGNAERVGTAVCWGSENPVDENNAVVPTEAGDPRADYGQAEVPPELQSVRIASISAGRYHTCAVREDNNALVCWGRPELTHVPERIESEKFDKVNVSDYFSCGVTIAAHVKCWGPESLNEPNSDVPVPAYDLNQFHVPEVFARADFLEVSAGPRHVCATQSDGRVYCWGADADPSTLEIDIYSGRQIINTRQAWVPRSFRALPPPIVIPPKPTADVRILRIEPSIRGVTLKAGASVVLGVEVYGRQDIRDDSLGDRADVTFAWTIEDATSIQADGEFHEVVESGDDREANGETDDRRVLHVASSEPGRYVIRAALDPGTECMPKLVGETEDDAVERCTAVFEMTVGRSSPAVPTPVPPRNPTGDIPSVIVDDGGTNYEVFTPEGGGEFATERCSFRAPEGSVDNGQVIGVSITELSWPEQQIDVEDPRFMTEGLQCRIDAVTVDGSRLSDNRLRTPGVVCMPLPDTFRPKAVDAFVGSINSDSTLTALSSKLYLATSAGGLNVCGNISSLSATTTVALRAEAAGELPPTPVPTPDVAEIDTGGRRPSEIQGLFAMLLGVAILALAVGLVFGRRRARDH